LGILNTEHSRIRKFLLPRLYAIIDRKTLDERRIPVSGFARQLAAAGVGIVQYRDKFGSPQQVLQAADEISAAFAGRECVFVMNDRADLAALVGWGVHVGQGDLLPADARRLVGDGMVGVSTHTEEQVVAADSDVALQPMSQKRDMGHPALQPMSQKRDMGHPGGAGYIAIGPVFATATKVDAEPVVGLNGVRRARALTTRPLVAIGGITRENCRSVVEAGADAVAVIGGLFVEGMSVGAVVEDFLQRMR
jgi:thiamine-phosphate pyrophosphorylase